MSREILIQTQKGERLVAIVEKGRVDEFHVEVDHYQSLLGNIYKGRVESVLPSINAAFINIGQAKNGFLYLTDVVENPFVEDDVISGPQKFINRFLGLAQPKPDSVSTEASDNPEKTEKSEKSEKTDNPEKSEKPQPDHKQRGNRRRPRNHQPAHKAEIPFKVGQEVLVQVVKDPFGEKGARLTTHISLPGRFVVYMPFDKHTGISRRIENREERQRLREVSQEFNFAKSGGYIIRTVSQEQGKDELLRDAKFLYKIWLKIFRKSEAEKAPALIYEEGELTWRIVRDYLNDKISKLVTDNRQDFENIRKFVNTLIGRQMVSKIEYYHGKTPLFEAKNISKDLQTIYDSHVHVKSGAHIVIEPTEGIIVVDVNSGRFKTRASPEEAAYMVNMEVIPEIARQLRLRDLGGIIVIDFIDMGKEDHRRRVHAALIKELSKDHAKTEVFKISQLGLVEMTRARTGKTIESLSFAKCPYCHGRGKVKIV